MDGCILNCAATLMAFDLSTGEGVNPKSCRLDRYDVKIEDTAIPVDSSGSRRGEQLWKNKSGGKNS